MSDAMEQTREDEGIIPLEPEPESKASRPPPVAADIPPPSAASKIKMLEECARLEREAYHLPTVLLIIGLAVSLVFTFIGAHFGEAAHGLPGTGLGVYLLTFVVGVSLGLLIFEICSAFGVVTEAPWRLTSLRLAAIFAMADSVAVVLFVFIPFGFIPEGVALIVFFTMLMWLLDLDVQDAGIVALSLYLPRFFLGLWFAMQFGLIP